MIREVSTPAANPYDILRDQVQAAVTEYYACTLERPGAVLVQMTPEQCHEVVTGMRHDPTVLGAVGYPVEQMVAKQLEWVVFNGTQVQVQVIRDVEPRIVVGRTFSLDLNSALGVSNG